MVEVVNNAMGIVTGPNQNQGAFSKVVDQITSESEPATKSKFLRKPWSQKSLDRADKDCENDSDAAQPMRLHSLSRR